MQDKPHHTIIDDFETRRSILADLYHNLQHLMLLNLTTITRNEHTSFLAGVQNTLADLIGEREKHSLDDLLSFSTTQLDKDQCEQNWSAVQERLNRLIKDKSLLDASLGLSVEALALTQPVVDTSLDCSDEEWISTQPQPVETETAVEDRLAAISEDEASEPSSEDEAAEPLAVTEGQLRGTLEDLLTYCSQIRHEKAGRQDSEALTQPSATSVIKVRVDDLMLTTDQIFDLLSIVPEKLTEPQYVQIFGELEHRLGDVILTASRLYALLNLSPEQLNDSQRDQVWAAVADRLDDIILTEEYPGDLVKLPPEKLNDGRRNQLAAVMMRNLSAILKDGRKFNALLKSLPQLNEEIWAWAIQENRLRDIIKTGDDLYFVLSLPPEYLNKYHAEVWQVMKDQLGDIIKNSSEFCTLLKFSQLNKDQCNQAFAAIEGRLGDLIEDGYQLKEFCKLSPDQLDKSQINRVLAVALGRGAIQNGSQLASLLNLPLKQLDEEQRNMILTARKEGFSALAGGKKTQPILPLTAPGRDSVFSEFSSDAVPPASDAGKAP